MTILLTHAEYDLLKQFNREDFYCLTSKESRRIVDALDKAGLIYHVSNGNYTVTSLGKSVLREHSPYLSNENPGFRESVWGGKLY